MKKVALISGILLFLSGCVEHNLNTEQKTITAPLVVASAEGDIDIFHDLIQKGVDIDATDQEGCTPLLGAIANGQMQIAKELILKGADINAKAKEGLTPLKIAEQQNHEEMVQLLKSYK